MLRNLFKRKRLPSSPDGAYRTLTKQQPITKSFVIKMVLIIVLGGPVVSALVFPFFDQMIRNKVDDWMSGPDLFESISITPKEYTQLPQYWRQALAEITLRSKKDAVDVQKIIQALKVQDVEIINLLAPYATHIGVIRDNNQSSEHPMPEMSYDDFSHLQNLGILEDVNNGRWIKLNENGDIDSFSLIHGATVDLYFKPKNLETKFTLESTAFTRGGMQLIEALRVPSNIAYFEWFAKKLEENGFIVELFTTSIRNISVSEIEEYRVRMERSSILAWPP